MVKNEKLKRDTWMTELLPRSSDLNSLKSCKFRQDISTPLHDASWFTSPSDDSRQLLTSSQEHKRKREKSSSPSSSPPSKSIRRPFDREKDLERSRVDTAARKAIIEHSKKLSSRFSHGSQQYL
ncbi:hypothetical protein Smp_164860 [Schistosoma mansoni]|uniref:hypothetical protein n=1 Tax=Schistosoma mansoni TaxID=6183 RepID=UPI0001A629A7|nr:hypothetical protein Smp_164860 [Schistosoma mansoni]|eukprot:XP_018653820.1 hypothetical protein Smp_164860 [Schistosoma mansoni]